MSEYADYDLREREMENEAAEQERRRAEREPFLCACVGGDPCPCRQAAWDRGEPWDRDREAFAAEKDKP